MLFSSRLTPLPLRPSHGFTFLELLTTMAALVIVVGLMVSLARYVRSTAADQITRQTLQTLDATLNPVATQPATAEEFTEVIPPSADEAAVAAYARRSAAHLQHLAGGNQPIVDAWGNPIGYLRAQDPRIGMAPQNRPFCFSAGPDGRYLTRGDNVYTYEQLQSLPLGAEAASRPKIAFQTSQPSVDKPNNPSAESPLQPTP